ncbi:MAG: hypothetical protein M3T56_08545 [Chloroflexota bacterium]|nr:hypothetical protein [Chloroflexota bacterium]
MPDDPKPDASDSSPSADDPGRIGTERQNKSLDDDPGTVFTQRIWEGKTGIARPDSADDV